MASWEDWFQTMGDKAVDAYVSKEAADMQNDAAYNVEQLRLMQRNQMGLPYLEGQAGFLGANSGQGFMSSTAGKVVLIGAALLVVVLAVK